MIYISKDVFNNYKENQDINLDEINLTDIENDGVIYEPSELSKNKSNRNKNNKVKLKRPQNFNFKIFLPMISISSLFIFGVVFYITYSSLAPNLISDIFANNNEVIFSEEQKDDYYELILNENLLLTGSIQNIDYIQKTAEIIDLTSNKVYNLYITGSTSLEDKYGKSLVLKEFVLGDIVDFSFTDKNNLETLTKNKNVTEYKSIQNINIDFNNYLIKFENKILDYSPYIKVTRNTEEYSLDFINSLDILNIKVYDDIIYSIEIDKSHGNLIFQNREGILNATVEIDTSIYKKLSEISEIALTEGTHKIVIKENSINTFVKEVYISPSQDTIIDLSEVQAKSGLLLINSNVSDYILYVNNEIRNTNEPLQLPYGAYKIKIEKSGYTSFETEVIINSYQRSLDITLESLQYAGKLSLTSNPESAEVYVDNIFVGYTPLTYKTSYGNHTVLLKKSGYEDFDLQNVYISDNETSFNVVLRQKEVETSTEKDEEIDTEE